MFNLCHLLAQKRDLLFVDEPIGPPPTFLSLSYKLFQGHYVLDIPPPSSTNNEAPSCFMVNFQFCRWFIQSLAFKARDLGVFIECAFERKFEVEMLLQMMRLVASTTSTVSSSQGLGASAT